MTTAGEQDLRYPVGRFHTPDRISEQDRDRLIEVVGAAPRQMQDLVSGLTAAQLDTPYRPGGWTVRQVIHHVPESHMHAYIRFKLALTETDPVVKPYDEAAWARLNDVAEAPIESSLGLLDCLHQRWVILMRGMSAEQWGRQYVHPEFDRGTMVLDRVLAMYAWHGEHHMAHIRQALT